MGRSLLITRPEHDPANKYLSIWSERIKEEAALKGFKVIDLFRDKAVRNRFIGILKKVKPCLVVINGHGSDSIVCGHNNETILTSSDKDVVGGKVIFARSCRSAKSLGQVLVKGGLISYLGYQNDFWLVTNPDNIYRPLEDRVASLFLEPSNSVVIYLLKGYQTGMANEKSKELFRKNIEKLVIQGPQSDNYYAVKFLY